MSESKHTPGPWEAEYIGLNGSFTIAAPDRDFVICSRNPIEHHTQASQANALLIAAAPDLLIVAKRALAVLKGQGESVRPHNVLGALAAAITKATGTSP